MTKGRGGAAGLYPGSLTRLRSGAIVLLWHRKESRAGAESETVSVPEYSVSRDGGLSWSTPRAFPSRPYRETAATSCRHPLLELDDGRWVLTCTDRTLCYDPALDEMSKFGDGRTLGMVPLVAVAGTGTLISGAPAEHWSGFIEVGNTNVRPRPWTPDGADDDAALALGLRSQDQGLSWVPMRQLGEFRVCGYDLTALANGWVVHTVVDYQDGDDGEVYEAGISLWLSIDGVSFDSRKAVEVYQPSRRVLGRSWPRTVELDSETVGTVFYDLAMDEHRPPAVLFVATPLSAFDADSRPQTTRL